MEISNHNHGQTLKLIFIVATSNLKIHPDNHNHGQTLKAQPAVGVAAAGPGKVNISLSFPICCKSKVK